MGRRGVIAAILAFVFSSGAAVAELDAALLSGSNTMCLGPDMVGAMDQTAADSAACEAACNQTAPCEFWSWCPSNSTGCTVRTFGTTLPGGTCLLSHDAKKAEGSRMVTVVSGPAVNWTCGYLAPGGSNSSGATGATDSVAQDTLTYLPIEFGDCKATCEKAGQTALDLSTAGAAACRVTIAADGGDNSTGAVFFGTKVSTSPTCDYNGGPDKGGASSDKFECVCVKDTARVEWRGACTAPATPAAKLPNVCRVSASTEDLNNWVAGYIYSDSCLFPGRPWGRLGSSTPPITQATGSGDGEGMDDASMGRQAHKLQVLCIV